MFVSLECACGEPLRFSATRKQYEPLAGSAAALNGHVAAVSIFDGVRTTVCPDAVCTAAPRDELAAKRRDRAGYRSRPKPKTKR
jgi:hypothetical protein